MNAENLKNDLFDLAVLIAGIAPMVTFFINLNGGA